MAVNTRCYQCKHCGVSTSTPRPSLSLCDFTAGPGSAPSSGGFEAVLFRGGMVAVKSHYDLAGNFGGLVGQRSPGSDELLDVAMWQAIHWSGRHVSDAARVRRCGSAGISGSGLNLVLLTGCLPALLLPFGGRASPGMHTDDSIKLYSTGNRNERFESLCIISGISSTTTSTFTHSIPPHLKSSGYHVTAAC